MGALCKEAVADAMTALLHSDKQAQTEGIPDRDMRSTTRSAILKVFVHEASAAAAAGSKRPEKYFRSSEDDF